MFSRLWLWLATRAASAWIAAGALALIGSLGIYIQQLRVEAARCESIESLKAQVEGFKAEIKASRAEDYDQIQTELERVADNCLDRASPLNELRRRP